ncbi:MULTISPECIES: 3,4-dihydroxyphenylacetate 2,3-dioxygenase [Roseobacteraceae]|jgi:catechol 2,3-dioxygenase|uniref:Manganese-dependent 2,3-dihydroxybiphenyl 1,2-dioxygenase n=1 Tax=Pseudosulfitobacter pseudonitzschiae TaxID=1402135 RepID=A0A221JWX0_9RHOB|nr:MULTISPECIES: 3,4-dihydroxyphenylacetate 2,3-dioxygenase [Roseobacteraceae]ASM71107.1 manganese-dependent 2,3-dihydroxybiphenyl 1,2-dioxygenase [Pseudosulfitobacter pseudonitzschiae]
MPVPAPVLYPPFNILRLSHVEYTVTDLVRSRAFWVDTLGLQVSHEEDGLLMLRAMEERGHHCIILRQSDAAHVHRLGFKLFDEQGLDKAAVWFKDQGLPTTWIERPFMGRVLQTQDPWGVPLEFYAKMDRLPNIAQKYALYRGVKPLRIDHFNLFSSDVDGAVAFYNQMGFRTTEYTEDAETQKVWAAWMHRKGGVHDIAFTNGFGPRLHHTAFWVPTPLNIIDLLDLMSTTGWRDNIERGPGRHGISNAFFLYILDPDGHRIEIYCSDYQTIDPDHEPIHWDLKDPSRQTLWGAPAPRSWFEHGSAFDGVDIAEPALKAQPIIAP